MTNTDEAFDAAALLAALVEAAREAGEMALGYFRPGERTSAAVESKEGGSPVTEADKLVDLYLKQRLGDLLPRAGWLSEETLDTAERLSLRRIFIVDPIDGTRAFMAGDPRWAVSIALVCDGDPELGIVHLPAQGDTFVALRGRGARLNEKTIDVSDRPILAGGRIAGPAGLLRDLESSGLAFEREPRVPSLAYRLVKVAYGALDACLASTDAYDWDIAAADLIVREAGGCLTDLAGDTVQYNRPDPRHGVLLASSRRLHGELIAATQRAREEGTAKGWDKQPRTNSSIGSSHA
ncbi:MAG TPA: 3'(2'),5'-bisphosphate nucleotidase CysQ [Beijerinckiaceae bacterium]|nr:3'(2'),5'-bisphosphate nucleotidase CysQ [Beijerinckiaceae bacterium]